MAKRHLTTRRTGMARTSLAVACCAGMLALGTPSMAQNAPTDAAASANGAQAARAATPDRAVLTTVLEATPWMDAFEAYGSIGAATPVLAVATSGGHLLERTVSAGDWVEKGDLLARTDDADAALALRAAEAAKASAETDLAEQNALLARGEALEGRAASSADVSTRRFARDRSETALERAVVAELQARLALERAMVFAPVSGWVLEANGDAGQQIPAGFAVARIAQEGRMRWTGGVPAVVAQSLDQGLDVAVETGGATLAGHIERVLPAVNAAGQAVVEVTLAPQDDQRTLGLDGAAARARFEVPGGNALSVPLESLVYRNGLPWLATVSQGVVAFMPVRIESVGSGTVRITGVEPGAAYVQTGGGFLAEGERVREAAQ